MHKALKPAVVFIKPVVIFLLGCFVLTDVYAQHTFESDSQSLLLKYQDTLQKAAHLIYSAQNNAGRVEENARFVKTLVNALKISHSFQFGFDSLKQISILKSPDRAFRIFSWQVPQDDGSYRFFGAIQMPTSDGKLKLYPLIDGTENFKDTNIITDPKNWYGSRYYEIVPIVDAEKSTNYVLLGWKGNNQKTSKKVMEVLSFQNGLPVFGKNIFMSPKNASVKNRVVFEYNKLNSMTLRLDTKAGMIVLDHLAPFSADMEGNFEFYGSDSSFDGYKAVGGKLKLIENIELKNDPNSQDELYIDPAIKNTPAPKKF
jgi:hypothetical protein